MNSCERTSALRLTASAIVALVAIFAAARSSSAQGGCGVFGTRPSTLAEDIAESDIVVFCRLIAGPATTAAGERSIFETTETLKGAETLARRSGAKSPFRLAAYLGDRQRVVSAYLIFGVERKEIEWGAAVPVNERELAYVRGLGKIPAKGAARLTALLPYLDDGQDLIAIDVHQELENLGYAEIRAARDRLPVANLRRWIVDPTTLSHRRRSYLRILSACGGKDDLPMLRTLIESDERWMKSSRDLSIACYLIFGGEDALQWIEEKFLKNPAAEYVEVNNALAGLRFVDRDTSAVPKSRIVTAFRSVLDKPQLADLVVADLQRLEDWDSAPRLVELFRAPSVESAYIRVPVINFLRRSPRTDAKTQLAELTKLDPGAANRAKRFDDLIAR